MDTKVENEFNYTAFLSVLDPLNELPSIICISRIFAFVTPTTSIISAKNLYDYDSSQYLSLMNYMQWSLKDLYQVIVFNLYCQNDRKNTGFLKTLLEEGKEHLNKIFNNPFNIELSILVKIVKIIKNIKISMIERFCK